MRILELHCDYVAYKPTQKALKTIADLGEEDKKEKRLENVLAVFTTMEKGDEKASVEKAALEVKKNFLEVKAKTILLYPYAHLSSNLAKPDEAIKLLDLFLLEIRNFCPSAEKSPFGYYKSFELKCKGHPLAELSKSITAETLQKAAGNTGIKEIEVVSGKEKVVVSDSLKKESELKSRFFILDLNGKLSEATSFDFSKHPSLKHFADYEIKKVRSYSEEPVHIKLMKEHKIADYEPGSDSGNMRWYPKGRLMKKLLERAISEQMVSLGAMEVETPVMYDFEHPSLKKYLNRFPARQYVVKSDDKDFFLRFAACFGQFLMTHDMTISHKNLPIRMFELTRYSFRREQSGEVTGLKRLRAFTMPDMHTICRDLDGAKSEFALQFGYCFDWLNDLKIPFETAFRVQEDFYKENEKWFVEFVKKLEKPVMIELFKERYAYFITKFEFNFVDSQKKASGLSTVQIDVENSETYDLNFVDESGKKQRPIILHASIPGAIERNIYALLEIEGMKMQEGKIPAFPVWLSPTQLRIIPISEKYVEDCKKMLKNPEFQNIRVDIDDRDDTLQKKIMGAEKEWVPFIAVVGQKELEKGTLSVRIRGKPKQEELSLKQLSDLIRNECAGKPFEAISLSKLLSKRPIF